MPPRGAVYAIKTTNLIGWVIDYVSLDAYFIIFDKQQRVFRSSYFESPQLGNDRHPLIFSFCDFAN